MNTKPFTCSIEITESEDHKYVRHAATINHDGVKYDLLGPVMLQDQFSDKVFRRRAIDCFMQYVSRKIREMVFPEDTVIYEMTETDGGGVRYSLKGWPEDVK